MLPGTLTPGDRPKAEIEADLAPIDHMLSGVLAQITLTIFGADLDAMRAIAEEFRCDLSAIPGVVDLQAE